jgi:hypothetical protein
MEYEYISPYKHRTLAILEENDLKIFSGKAGEEPSLQFYNYSDIVQVNLSVRETNWFTINITFRDGYKLLLKSISFDPVKSNKLTQKMEHHELPYLQWVTALHTRLIEKGLAQTIRFIQGNAFLFIGLIAIAIGAVIAFIMALSIRKYGLAFTMGGGCLFLIVYARKVGFRRPYDPAALPAKYLP